MRMTPGNVTLVKLFSKDGGSSTKYINFAAVRNGTET